ncbi:Uncharacterised protein [Chlamydia abortus]|uniref:YqzL family protein n=1 Tax=Paenibacillus residui TaxID=629724 RepID=A0ABW3DBM3_9BACL|nr:MULTISPECIES: YqzL family protein [Paenibacillaceae]SHE10406.1 Uncharacterised protein [Chlamydia abortus]
MREFYWDYFTRTGNIDAYLLYKDKDDWPEDEWNLTEEEPDREEWID